MASGPTRRPSRWRFRRRGRGRRRAPRRRSARPTPTARPRSCLPRRTPRGRFAVVVIASCVVVRRRCERQRVASLDWDALGLDAALSRIEQPAITGLQQARAAVRWAGSHSVEVRAGSGVVLVVRGESRTRREKRAARGRPWSRRGAIPIGIDQIHVPQ